MSRDFRIGKSQTMGKVGSDLVWAVVDLCWNYAVALDESDDKNLRRFFSLTPGQRAVISTLLLDIEVCNGGFEQFYGNSSGFFAKDAVDGFNLIGALELADVVKQANFIFQDGSPPRNWTKRIEEFQKINSLENKRVLDNLANLYYELVKDGDIPERFWVVYIQSHPEEFYKD